MKNKPRLEVLAQIGFWLILMLIYMGGFNRYLDFKQSLFRMIGNVVPMAIIFYVNIYLVNKYLERKAYLQFGIGGIILVISLMIVRMQINYITPVTTEMILAKKIPIVSWAIAAFFTNILILSFSTFYQLLLNRFKAERRNQAIINEQNEAQIKFLRSQINPHFLFNTLNNIYSLAVVRSEKTADMVLKLSNLLRYVIYEGQVEQVNLKKELEQIEQYIGLFQLKSEDPLNITLEVSGPIEDWNLEPMILIPIVENCFKHCDFEINPQAFVQISLMSSENELSFQTINTFNKTDDQKDKIGGVGLENIWKRLALKYEDKHQLEILKKEQTFEVKLKLNKKE